MPVTATPSRADHPIAPSWTPHMPRTHGANPVDRLLVELAMDASLAERGTSIAGPAPDRAALGMLAPRGAGGPWARHASLWARRRLASPAAPTLGAFLFSAAGVGPVITAHAAPEAAPAR